MPSLCIRHLSAILVGLMLPCLSLADSGRVVRVLDGDTIEIRSETSTVRIRIAGIDAPEKRQAFGEVAKRELSRLCFNKTADFRPRKTDRYKRTIAAITCDGTDAGLAMLQGGFAWHYKKYAKEQPQGEREAYALAETKAKGARHGLWRDDSPIPPWEWRRPAAK
jgi:endonuclease YncB( thermonuclease family)